MSLLFCISYSRFSSNTSISTCRTTRVDFCVEACPIALNHIGREEAPHHGIVIAGIIVVQPGDAIVILPGEAFGGAHAALLVARGAIGTVHLVALHRGAVG